MVNEVTEIDQYVRREIEKFNINYDEQGSSNPEIAKALRGASKQGGKGVGKPEFIIKIEDYLLVIEDKRDNSRLINMEGDKIAKDIISLSNYAVNGAVHYANHIVQKTDSFDEVIAIGITGKKESYNIQPVLITKTNGEIKERILSQISSLQEIHPERINEWYSVNVLGGVTNEQKQIFELQYIAKELHEDLRNYASLEGENKATVISAILLALNEKTFKVTDLLGDDTKKDGMIIIEAVETYIKRDGNIPEEKASILLNKFDFLKTNVRLNEKNIQLGNTPLRYFANKLNKKVIRHFKENTNYDILGNFYGEFVKYGGGDGNGLGIVLTPSHITTLMTELIDILPTDYVLDPACGTGSFLISAMNRMTAKAKDNAEIRHIKQYQLMGIELQEKMFTVATTNMILRGDGKSNLYLNDMFNIQNLEMQNKKVNKILFNPPYAQGKTNKILTEISFIKSALEMLVVGGKLAVIVPQSTMVGKSKEEQEYKKIILENNTLELVITMNKDTFHGVGTNPVIAIFEAGKAHPRNKKVKFVNFEDDGYIVRKHIGLVDDGTAKEKRKKILDIINGDVEEYSTEVMVKSAIKSEDEWLHSFFYFNDALPEEREYKKIIADYLTFQFDMHTHGRGYLFAEEDYNFLRKHVVYDERMLNEVEWDTFFIDDIINVESGVRLKKVDQNTGDIPFIGATDSKNGITQFIDNRNKSTDKNVLGVNYNGSIGYAFYHGYEATFSDDVKKMNFKEKNSKYILLFLKQIIEREAKRYTYGYKFSGQRIRRQIIKLPVKNGNPDFEFMECYMKRIENQILSEIRRIM